MQKPHSNQHDVARAASRFQLQGKLVSAQPYGSGHINDTYEVVIDQAGTRVRYILQRINHTIFQDVPALMENVARTTRHVRSRLEAEGVGELDRRVLTLVPTLEGDSYHQDEDGLFWRTYVFIEQARTYDVIEDDTLAYEAAKAFGRFQRLLADLPQPRLHETIPNFHHTRSRFDALVDAVQADTCNRAASARGEIDFVLGREGLVDVLLDLHRQGELPERTTHNDTKLNNVMIDDETSEGVCVIDLDTVMPGLSLYDLGDMIRTGTNTAAEDERDLSKVTVSRNRYRALVKGYLDATGDVLTGREKDLLVFSGKLITLEIGIRFLTDFLAGDVYFKVHRDGHSLDRCRTQFKLVKDTESQEEDLQQWVRSLSGS